MKVIRVFSGGHAQRSAGARGQRATDITEEDAQRVRVGEFGSERHRVVTWIRPSCFWTCLQLDEEPSRCVRAAPRRHGAPEVVTLGVVSEFVSLVLRLGAVSVRDFLNPGPKCPTGAASSDSLIDSPTSRERSGRREGFYFGKRCFILKRVRNVNFELQ